MANNGALVSTVFLSHSSKDKPIAKRIATDLTQAGIDVWFDEWEIKVGDSISQKIQQALDAVDFVAVVLSSESLKSGWVEKEWQAKVGHEAQTRQTMILPLKVDDCPLPPLLRDKKYADFGVNYGKAIREVIEVLTACTTSPGRNDNLSGGSTGSLVFSTISTVDGFWNGGRVTKEPDSFVIGDRSPFARQCSFRFGVTQYVTGPDPSFDITALNTGIEPLLVSEVGVRVVTIGHVYPLVGGIPEAVEVQTLAEYILEMPSLYEILDAEVHRRGSSLRAPSFELEVDKYVSTTLPNPVYLEPKAPFRFKLLLKGYWKGIPPAIIRLTLLTSDGLAQSEEILMQ